MIPQPLANLEPSNTGGSTGSRFSSRNPYRTSADGGVSRNTYHTPQESPAQLTFGTTTTTTTTAQAQTLSSHPPNQAARMTRPDNIYSSTTPPLPTRPTQQSPTSSSAPRPRLPQREAFPSSAEAAHETHPGFTSPLPSQAYAAAAADDDHDDHHYQEDALPSPQLPAAHDHFARRDSSLDPVGQPPRRRLTTGDIPLNSVGYARDPQRLVAYLIPLPAPTRQGQPMAVPQRYMLYTPPAPHLLKPPQDASTSAKEGKRHKLKRLAQQEIKKAKTYEGRTVSLRGLHSKTLRGVDWAVGAIKNADITFFSRVPRKEVNELILIHPASLLAHQSPEEVHKEFTDQLARTKRKAAAHSMISVALFVPGIVIDTLAAIVWPFGGLAEIDGVWAYASISAWLTARSVSKRLSAKPISSAGPEERRRLQRELHGEQSPERSDDDGILRSEGERPRTGNRTVRFQEELDEEDEKMRGDRKQDGKRTLQVRFVPDEAMETIERYFQEILHKRNPRAFPSSGVPPTKTDVLASIGWWPDRRGRFPGSHQEGDWDDENVSLHLLLVFGTPLNRQLTLHTSGKLVK